MKPRYQILRAVCEHEEFNAIRSQLPQASRRDVEPAPQGHFGLMVQAIAEDGCPLVTLYDHIPESAGIEEAFSELETRIREALR
jgi:hypothetical protein